MGNEKRRMRRGRKQRQREIRNPKFGDEDGKDTVEERRRKERERLLENPTTRKVTTAEGNGSIWQGDEDRPHYETRATSTTNHPSSLWSRMRKASLLDSNVHSKKGRGNVITDSISRLPASHYPKLMRDFLPLSVQASSPAPSGSFMA